MEVNKQMENLSLLTANIFLSQYPDACIGVRRRCFT